MARLNPISALAIAVIQAVAVPLAVPLALVASAAPGAAESSAADHAYRALPELPTTAPQALEVNDRATVEAAAIDLAVSLRALPTDESATTLCAADKLQVSWTAPDARYGFGAYLDPVGPAPNATTTNVNGVVLCQGNDYSFMGFEAWRAVGTWQLAAVPFVVDEEAANNDADPPHATPPAVPDAPSVPAVPSLPPPALDPGNLPTGSIEGYAAYEPQRLCDPTAKAGTVALRNLLLGNNPGTRNLGITRGCGVGGQSEHKEGRALDWGVLVSRANENAAANRFVEQLLATDAAGNRHALARRMGVMYVIWNRQIWSAYRADQGWRAYGGASPHTDHIHISLSWAGALGRTSFWSGTVDNSTLRPAGPAANLNQHKARPEKARARERKAEVSPHEQAERAAARDAAREQRRQERAARHEAELLRREQHEAEAAARKAAARAARDEYEARRDEARAARKAAEQQQREERAAARAEAEQQRREEKVAARAEAEQQRREEKAARREARRQAEAERRERRRQRHHQPEPEQSESAPPDTPAEPEAAPEDD